MYETVDNIDMDIVSASIRRTVKTGFRPKRSWLHRSYNFLIAFTLIVMVMPLLIMISLVLFLTQGWNIIYRGPRIGLGHKTFNIFKFRTLDSARAAQITSDKVLSEGSGLETPLGKFLRDTRLDELPQLFNVLIGDMNMCGPRPVRPQMAELYRSKIPWFDIRFEVKPGLVGHSQAFMSHGTSEMIRERYNALLCRAPVRYAREIELLALVGACVLARGVAMSLRNLGRRLLGRSAPDADGQRARDLQVCFQSERSGRNLGVSSVNAGSVTLDEPQAIEEGEIGWLICRLPDGGLRRGRVILQRGDAGTGKDSARFDYVPDGPFSAYILSRYMMTAVVVPHRSLLPLASVRRHAARRPAQAAATAEVSAGSAAELA
jgi:lipopolysaccharide/colanic/teichoic acid biosynthesis glycosyltransferase